ncbi:MAG: hypothetical protein ABEJ44_02545 [Halanaeroarchaeum sp.]
MSLDDLTDDVDAAYADLDDAPVSLDEESRTELALLATALETDDVSDLVQRGVHLLFQSTVDTGKLDFHLRSRYDVTYDEYLSGMTYDEMTGGAAFPQDDEDTRRYQF